MRVAIALALLATVVAGVPSSAPTATHTGPGTIVVSGGTLIDGTVREPIPNATVVVRDGLVTDVSRGSDVRWTDPDGYYWRVTTRA